MRLQEAAAKRFLHIGLELGGNDPAYVAAMVSLTDLEHLLILADDHLIWDATSGVVCLVGADYGAGSDPVPGDIYLYGPRPDLVPR